jgi:hypothetical protein
MAFWCLLWRFSRRPFLEKCSIYPSFGSTTKLQHIPPHCLSLMFERFKWRLVTRVLGPPPHGGQRAVEEGSARIRADKRQLKAGAQFESMQACSRHRSSPKLLLDSSLRQVWRLWGGVDVGKWTLEIRKIARIQHLDASIVLAVERSDDVGLTTGFLCILRRVKPQA